MSYAKLQATHTCTFLDDKFTAYPKGNGPVLTFNNVNGHYTMNVTDTIKVYVTQVTERLARYNKKQIDGARKAYDFIERLGFISYKAATEVLRRSSIGQLGFSRADLVNCQDFYGRTAAYLMGHGTQKSTVPGEDDPIPTHESVDQELQINCFFMFGQIFFISISVLEHLIVGPC